MRKVLGGLFFAVLMFAVVGIVATAEMQSNESASDNVFSRLEIIVAPQSPPQKPAGKLEQIELMKNGAGWTRTANKLWRTSDNGFSWREITPPKAAGQRLSGAAFADENHGFVVLGNVEAASFEFARTIDGGASWTKQNLELPAEVLSEANFNEAVLDFADDVHGLLAVRLASSSNFTRWANFTTKDAGNHWQTGQFHSAIGEVDFRSLANLREQSDAIAIVNGKTSEFMSERRFSTHLDAPLSSTESVIDVDFSDLQNAGRLITNLKNAWLLVESGFCQNFKSDCEQSARILATGDGGKNWREITPPEAKTAVKIADARQNSPNVLPPNGSTRISMNRGFDKCTAAPPVQMQTWWNESPFYDSNIYIAGRNRGCTQAQLTAAWVNQVSTMGWGLIPTVVGYQAPCSVCTTCQKHSLDSTVAETQGREEADIAIAAANNLGLTQGTVLYYDMERYDNPTGTTECGTSVKAFLKGWTDRVKQQGYISGVYGSPTNAANDWVNIAPASQPDAIWMARWNDVASVWSVAPLGNNVWTKHQRIHQYQAPHNETWGGVTFNIDGNISDAPVAGVRAAKNKHADFDGDGKSDISVFRPDTGGWYISQSATGAFQSIGFGASGDRIVPGDYDADGKTDAAVYRPSSGVWYQMSFNPARPNALVVRSRAFGVATDVPAAADYDGDGHTDIAVFRDGTWFITSSFDFREPTFRSESFGAPGDLPAPGDYDADGKADLAVFRPSTGSWYVQRSTAGFLAAQFGTAGDKPVQGDYDNDGKTDIAVFRPSNGVWYLLGSTAGFSSVFFGAESDVPAPGDFDGDGKTDIAVFRPESGNWFISQSQNGFLSVPFGANGDVPVPNGYLP